MFGAGTGRGKKGKPFSTTGMMPQTSDGLAKHRQQTVNLLVLCFGKASCVNFSLWI